jgi:hypothetical protein
MLSAFLTIRFQCFSVCVMVSVYLCVHVSSGYMLCVCVSVTAMCILILDASPVTHPQRSTLYLGVSYSIPDAVRLFLCRRLNHLYLDLSFLQLFSHIFSYFFVAHPRSILPLPSPILGICFVQISIP